MNEICGKFDPNVYIKNLYFYFFSALLNASAGAKKCAFFQILDLIRPILSTTFKNDSSIFPSKPNISLNKKQQFVEVLRFSGSEAVMNFMSSFLQQVEREGRVAARGSGGHIYYFEVLRPVLDDSPAVDVGDADNEQHSSRPNLPDIRNEPEPDSHPYNEVGIDIEIESVSESAIEREECCSLSASPTSTAGLSSRTGRSTTK